MKSDLLPRMVAPVLADAADSMPVVVLTGARQTGKTTLLRDLQAAGPRTYLSLDDLDTLGQARSAPADLLARGERLTLDEVQRAPDLLMAVKESVDRDRRPGRYIMTGSANLLLARTVSESLAGRATYTTLWPLTRREQLGLASPGRWSELLDTPEGDWAELLSDVTAGPEDWRALARRGGYPTPAVDLQSDADRRRWFDGYTRTYLERDLQELASISALPDFRRVMRAAALRAGQLLNQAELGRDVGTPGPTVHRWLNLLEVTYQLLRLPAYSVNRTRRLIKSPKIYWSDTAMGLNVADDPEPTGAHLENLVLTDLLAWREVRDPRPAVLYWRTTSGAEVDFVIEAEGRLLPIEVKATRRPRVADAVHLRTFREEYGEDSLTGLLLHDGEGVEWLGAGVLAVPWWGVV